MRSFVIRRLATGALCAAMFAACNDAGASTAPTAAAQPSAGNPAGAAPILVWPLPPDQMGLTAVAGLQPETVEHLAYHVHAHLDIFVDGAPVIVPSAIGINIEDPGVKAFPEPDGSTSYGGIEGCAVPCISPLHTHDQTGIIHTESQASTPNKLGQLFVEWGVELSPTCVGEHCSPETPIAIYLNGDAFTGDPREILLSDLLEIAIVIGTPPAQIPSSADFSNA